MNERIKSTRTFLNSGFWLRIFPFENTSYRYSLVSSYRYLLQCSFWYSSAKEKWNVFNARNFAPNRIIVINLKFAQDWPFFEIHSNLLHICFLFQNDTDDFIPSIGCHTSLNCVLLVLFSAKWTYSMYWRRIPLKTHLSATAKRKLLSQLFFLCICPPRMLSGVWWTSVMNT